MQTLSPHPLVASNTHSSTKIKPILLPYCRQKTIDDLSAMKSSKSHVRNLQKMRFYQYDTRFAPWNRSLKSFVNTVKNQNSLSSLYYQLFSQFEFNTALFSKEFRGLSSLSSLKLEVGEYPANATYVQVFMKTLASFKNLTHLDLQYHVYKTKRSPAIEDLFESLACLSKLTGLSLTIHLGSNALGDELELFSACLSRLTKLRSLKLTISGFVETNEKSLITALPFVLSKMPHLAHIELNLFGRATQVSALLKLFWFFGTIKSLSSIKTDLIWGRRNIENPTEIISECLACLDASSIRQLNLYVSSASLNKLPQALERFTSLNALCLNFRHFNVITDENVPGISSMLGCLTSLEFLTLTFPRLETDILVEDIANVLTLLHNLKFLELTFGQLRKISGKQVQQLFASLKPSLQFLNIDIHESKFMEDDSKTYEKLGENLKELVLLKNLSLNLGRNNVIKNAEIESIIDAIKGLPSLTSLELRLGGLEDIDETVIEKIAEALRALPLLSSVTFQLNQCKKLREKEDSLLSLFNALKGKESIIDIRLWISYSKTNKEQTTELWRLKDIYLAWC